MSQWHKAMAGAAGERQNLEDELSYLEREKDRAKKKQKTHRNIVTKYDEIIRLIDSMIANVKSELETEELALVRMQGIERVIVPRKKAKRRHTK